jgi:thiol-disulfide isomerase/thioredoxin
MQVTRRQAIVMGTAALAGGTLAAATLWRKPEPRIFGLANAQTTAAPLAGLRTLDPPAPPAPARFTDGDGKSFSLADFPGQGLIVNLWATWCVPCVAEMPQLEAAARALAPERIAVLPLSSDRGGASVVRKFYASHDIQGLTVWLDPKGEAARAWGARGLPTTLVIDREGREVARLEGAYEWAQPAVLAELRRLIG